MRIARISCGGPRLLEILEDCWRMFCDSHWMSLEGRAFVIRSTIAGARGYIYWLINIGGMVLLLGVLEFRGWNMEKSILQRLLLFPACLTDTHIVICILGTYENLFIQDIL